MFRHIALNVAQLIFRNNSTGRIAGDVHWARDYIQVKNDELDRNTAGITEYTAKYGIFKFASQFPAVREECERNRIGLKGGVCVY